MSEQKYLFIGNCSVHGTVITTRFSTTAPSMCPIDDLNPYTNTSPYQKRPKTNYPLNYTNSVVSQAKEYEVVGHICWPGSDDIGFIDTAMMTGFVTKGTTGSIMIVDITNKTTILEFNDIYGETTTIYDLGIPTNLSNNMAVWEIQMKATDLGTVCLNSLSIK